MLDRLLDASAVVAAAAKHRPAGRLRQGDEHRNGHLTRLGVSGDARCREDRSRGIHPSNYSPELRARSVRMVAELEPDHPWQYAGIIAVAQKLAIETADTLRKSRAQSSSRARL